MFDADTSRPLELPLATGCDDFVEQVNESGRFRLEAVDADGRVIPGCVAVTEVVVDEEDDAQTMPKNATEALPELMRLVGQLVDSNARVMKAMASAFGHVQPSQPLVIERNAEVGRQSESQVGQVVAAASELCRRARQAGRERGAGVRGVAVEPIAVTRSGRSSLSATRGPRNRPGSPE